MCGIAGILHFPPSPTRAGQPRAGRLASARESAERMIGELRHRGPDGSGVETLGTHNGGALALGHTRLAILDVSNAGRQPMASSDRSVWITFNGEIYNFWELRQRLGAPVGGWRSRSDTEVLLRAYERWGFDCVHRVRGMFAFAIWDSRIGELFLARDRLGIKPLYYAMLSDTVLFASEVRALLATGLVPRRLDPLALDHYLAYQSVPAPRTLLQDVRALAPGSWMRVDVNGQITQGTYWDLLSSPPPPQDADPTRSQRRLGELLRESMQLHLVSDVPVGVFLSGGIDSSALVALVAEAGHVPRTFSIGFAERAFDEAPHARLVASRFGAEHTEVLLKQEDLLEQLPDALAAMDQPTGDAINTYVVSAAVRATGIKVALSGLGGDELFAGYPSFRRLRRWIGLLRAWGRLPLGVRRSVAASVRAVGPSSIAVDKLAATLESDGELASLFPLTREVLSPGQRRALLEPTARECGETYPDSYRNLLELSLRQAPAARGLLARISYAEARTYMHDLLLRDTDQMSMAHALEVRVPLLDHVLAEYVIGLPDAHKWPGATPKRLLVESLGGLLPREIVYRPKQGFTLPFDPWMRGPLRDFCETRLVRLGSRGLLRPEPLTRLWRAFLARDRSVSWSRVWMLVVLDEWLERHAI